MLTAKTLISRMTPMTLASMISDLDQYGNMDAAERETMAALRANLEAIVGKCEAERLVCLACDGSFVQ